MTVNYAEAVSYLRSREKFGIKAGLENIDRIAESLGRPERRFRSILVAGTNGKGSTVALLSSILRAAGLRTGRYTSPHILRFEERIHIDGRPISEDELAWVLSRVAAASGGVEPTFFEALTATAFTFFAEKQVDVGVLEIGMGGRWDATNIAPAELSVITPIGFDHEKFLGDSIATIAAEKAAIIKAGRPVIVGRLHRDAMDVVVREAARRDATAISALDGVSVHVKRTLAEGGQRVELSTPSASYGEMDFPLAGGASARQSRRRRPGRRGVFGECRRRRRP